MAIKKAVKNKKVVEKKDVEEQDEEMDTEEHDSDEDSDDEAIPAKKKGEKVLDIEPADIAEDVSEKIPEEDENHLPFMDDEDEAGIDGDDMDPFGDKWEE